MLLILLTINYNWLTECCKHSLSLMSWTIIKGSIVDSSAWRNWEYWTMGKIMMGSIITKMMRRLYLPCYIIDIVMVLGRLLYYVLGLLLVLGVVVIDIVSMMELWSHLLRVWTWSKGINTFSIVMLSIVILFILRLVLAIQIFTIIRLALMNSIFLLIFCIAIWLWLFSHLNNGFKFVWNFTLFFSSILIHDNFSFIKTDSFSSFFHSIEISK